MLLKIIERKNSNYSFVLSINGKIYEEYLFLNQALSDAEKIFKASCEGFQIVKDQKEFSLNYSRIESNG